MPQFHDQTYTDYNPIQAWLLQILQFGLSYIYIYIYIYTYTYTYTYTITLHCITYVCIYIYIGPINQLQWNSASQQHLVSKSLGHDRWITKNLEETHGFTIQN